MPHPSGLRLLGFILTVVVSVSPGHTESSSQTLLASPSIPVSATASPWATTQAEHIDGLPDIKPHKKGTLTLSADSLTFTGKSGNTTIPRSAILAISAGNQRVEMWGMTGRIMRMAIPDNGGLAVAAVAHHRIDILTVDFSDTHGGAHSAVFFLGAKQADEAIHRFALVPREQQAAVAPDCSNALTEPGSLLVSTPDWRGAQQVPAAYQGLLYEHLVERFRKSPRLTRVYREGESFPAGLCPQYTVHLSATGFKEGSSVQRAMLGPVGMFVGTTQMIFNAEVTDRTGTLNLKAQVKSTIRGETESTNIADMIAKALAKKYEQAVKTNEKKTQLAATRKGSGS